MAIGQKDKKIIEAAEKTGEPIIVFRAKDLLSVDVIKYYYELNKRLINNPATEFFNQLNEKVAEFTDWQELNPLMVKLPD